MKLYKYLFLVLGIIFSPLASSGQIIVAGASSLTDVFKEISQKFEQQYDDISVLTSFAASDVVLQQIINGAPIDVFASADRETMDRAQNANLIKSDSRFNFAVNELVLITPVKSSYVINSIDDVVRLATKKANFRVAIGNPKSVPVGRYTKEALNKLGLWQTISPKQITAQNVRQALAYVKTGEVDAGFVFATDAAIFADKVKVVQSLNVGQTILYSVALVQNSNGAARLFMDFMASASAQTILRKYGFKIP